MSIFHRWEEWELSDTSVQELYEALGANDTPRIFDQPFTLNTEHDWPAGAGMSLDRKTLYFDRMLYQEIMDNALAASALTPVQIIAGWSRHERVETAIVLGNNPVDTYLPAHHRALAAEHELYRAAGVDPAVAEKAFWPALVRCYDRPIKKPPLDVWCGPLLDDYEGNEHIIEQLIKLKVQDAGQHSKYQVRYGLTAHRCDRCRMWAPDKLSQEYGALARCTAVDGVVRDDRGCDLWLPRNERTAAT